MTDIESVKAFLNRVRDADKLIDLKQMRLEELKALSTAVRSPDYSSDRVQTSPQGDTIGNIVAKIVDLQEEINADIDRFVDLKADVMHNIDRLTNPDEKVVLYGKYFEYKTMQQIADEVPCCKRTVQRLHKEGLKKLSLIVTPKV